MTQLALTSVWTTQLLNTVSNEYLCNKMAHTVRHFCLYLFRLRTLFASSTGVLFCTDRLDAQLPLADTTTGYPARRVSAFKLRLINRVIPAN